MCHILVCDTQTQALNDIMTDIYFPIGMVVHIFSARPYKFTRYSTHFKIGAREHKFAPKKGKIMHEGSGRAAPPI